MQEQSTITQAAMESPDSSPQPEPSQPEPSLKSRLKGSFSTIALLIGAPLIAIFLTSFVFQSYEVEGMSMERTLQNKDRLIVLKVPRTVSRLTGNTYVPERYEVVVFVKRNIYEAGEGGEKQLIKRVIGLPGERVVVQNGTLTIYNKESPEGFQPDKGKAYFNTATGTPGNVDLTVPAGEVFVCGDNRAGSLDSRNFGSVPATDVVGDLFVRILPLNKMKKF